MKFKWPILFPLAVLLAVLFVLIQQTGALFYRFPAHGDFTAEEGPAGRRLARRVVVVVADGLGLDGLTFMPFARALGAAGGLFTARTEAPSMSRVGYTVLATGAKPEVSGVSSNSVKEPVRIGNIFRTARDFGQRSAFVGYSWWLDHFDPEIPLASVDTGIAREDHRLDGDLLAGFRRRVLVDGTYAEITGSWRAFFQERALFDAFGDPAATPAKEDDLRANEAVRIIREDTPDLLFLHLHSPDDEGHRTGSYRTVQYRKACSDVDRALRTVAGALDFSRDVLVLSADHGFSDTIVDAGHGGHEDSASLVPFVIAGARVRAGVEGPVRQIDIQPTLSVLLGLPFSSHAQGAPILHALDLEEAAVRERAEAFALARERFLKAYAAALGKELAGPDFETGFERARAWIQTWYFVAHFVPALIGLVLFAWFLARSRPIGRAGALTGLILWIVYEGLFLALYRARYGEYSFSSFANANDNVAFMIFSTFMILGALFAVGKQFTRSAYAPAAVVFLALWAKALPIFGLLGTGAPVFHPGGFVLFAGISFYAQLFAGTIVLGTVVALPKRNTAPG